MKYTDEQLKFLDAELSQFAKVKCGTTWVYPVEQYLESRGAVSIVQDGTYTGNLIIRNTQKYQELTEMLDQWISWKGRQEFLEEKIIEGLEKVAEEMTL